MATYLSKSKWNLLNAGINKCYIAVQKGNADDISFWYDYVNSSVEFYRSIYKGKASLASLANLKRRLENVKNGGTPWQ